MGLNGAEQVADPDLAERGGFGVHVLLEVIFDAVAAGVFHPVIYAAQFVKSRKGSRNNQGQSPISVTLFV